MRTTMANGYCMCIAFDALVCVHSKERGGLEVWRLGVVEATLPSRPQGVASERINRHAPNA